MFNISGSGSGVGSTGSIGSIGSIGSTTSSKDPFNGISNETLNVIPVLSSLIDSIHDVTMLNPVNSPDA